MNEPQHILTDIARGHVPLKYRAALQNLIKQKGQSFLRASYYNELLQEPGKYPLPLKKAMKNLHASRATIFRDYKMYKHLFEVNHV